MDSLKNRFAEKALPFAKDLKEFVKTHGNEVMGTYTLDDVYSGQKGIIGLITETSLLDANEGIRFRGYSIPELREKLPHAPDGVEPLPEGVFFLMLMDLLPSEEEAHDITNNWARRAIVPKHVFSVLDAFPAHTHPMTQFSAAIMALQTESYFAAAYRKGINKKDYWDPTYEDTMTLIARLPRIAAYIYRRTYKNGVHIEPDPKLDWAGNFAHMLGFDAPDFAELMRLYMTIHSDHEGGNVSAHTTHLVGSALSDPYLSFSAAMNGLAGPLHGLANQEVVRWLEEMCKELNVSRPTNEQIAEYVKKTLSEGKVVPGYGHAVLRKTDPRFTAQQEFAKRHMPDDDMVNTVWNVYETVPPILEGLGKVKNPWPNVDAHSGALLRYYGLIEEDYYTVLFGVSRSLGVLASLCWDRAIGLPLERPKSVTTEWVKNKFAAK
jgi:citrate synthase